MCIGVPMQVVAGDGAGISAVCDRGGERKRIDMMLVGEQPPGTWVLEFHGAARRVMTAEEAAQSLAALRALEIALGASGDVTERAGIDALFADLVDRGPQLPEHLRSK